MFSLPSLPTAFSVLILSIPLPFCYLTCCFSQRMPALTLSQLYHDNPYFLTRTFLFPNFIHSLSPLPPHSILSSQSVICYQSPNIVYFSFSFPSLCLPSRYFNPLLLLIHFPHLSLTSFCLDLPRLLSCPQRSSQITVST